MSNEIFMIKISFKHVRASRQATVRMRRERASRRYVEVIEHEERSKISKFWSTDWSPNSYSISFWCFLLDEQLLRSQLSISGRRKKERERRRRKEREKGETTYDTQNRFHYVTRYLTCSGHTTLRVVCGGSSGGGWFVEEREGGKQVEIERDEEYVETRQQEVTCQRHDELLFWAEQSKEEEDWAKRARGD